MKANESQPFSNASSGMDDQPGRREPAEGWLLWLALLVFTVLYLVFELRYNARLIDFTGQALPGRDEADALELEGRRLAAAGAVVLVLGFYFPMVHSRLRRVARTVSSLREGKKTARRWPLLLSLIGALLLGTGAYQGMFQLQERIIDEIVAQASPEDLRNASLLQVLRIGVLTGALQDPRFPYQGSLADKLDLAQLFLVLRMDPEVIERVAGTTDEAIYRVVSCNNYRDHYPGMESGYLTMRNSYNEYVEASRQVLDERQEISRRIVESYQDLMQRIPQATRSNNRETQIQRFNSPRGRAQAEREFPDSRYLPRPWDLELASMNDALRPVYERRLNDSFNTRLSEAYDCSMAVEPGLPLDAFWSNTTMQSCLVRRLNLDRPVPLAAGNGEFWRQVWLPWNDARVADFIADYGDFSLAAYSDLEAGARDNGIDAIKMLYILPIAIGFSCVFAALNLINLLAGKITSQLMRVIAPGLGTAPRLIVIATIGATVLTGVLLGTRIENTTANALYQEHLAQTSPLLSGAYRLVLRLETLVYWAGSVANGTKTGAAGAEQACLPEDVPEQA